VLPAIGAAFPEAANNRVKVLPQMFTWACSPEYGYAEKNPARDVAKSIDEARWVVRTDIIVNRFLTTATAAFSRC
jgi:hypothetical protein